MTRVGRFIRKTSIDELPQLINVLRGELSLVGPRPHATQTMAANQLYQDVVSGYFARHRMKPGITGWAQVNGWRGETDTIEKIERRVEHDLYYIENWSLALDLHPRHDALRAPQPEERLLSVSGACQSQPRSASLDARSGEAQMQIVDLDLETIREGLADGSILLIDVREPHEFQMGHIPDSVSLPLSTFDPADIPRPRGGGSSFPVRLACVRAMP